MGSDSERRSGCWKWGACGCGGCLIVVLAAVAFVAAVGGLAFFGMKKSEAYEEALQRARQSPEVIEALGEPIEAGFLVSGSFSVSGPSGEAELQIPISGPTGDGSIYVVATKSGGRWDYSVLEVEVEATGERIDLIDLADLETGTID